MGKKSDKAVGVPRGKSVEASRVMSLGSKLVGPEEEEEENDTDLEGKEPLRDSPKTGTTHPDLQPHGHWSITTSFVLIHADSGRIPTLLGLHET